MIGSLAVSGGVASGTGHPGWYVGTRRVLAADHAFPLQAQSGTAGAGACQPIPTVGLVVLRKR